MHRFAPGKLVCWTPRECTAENGITDTGAWRSQYSVTGRGANPYCRNRTALAVNLELSSMFGPQPFPRGNCNTYVFQTCTDHALLTVTEIASFQPVFFLLNSVGALTVPCRTDHLFVSRLWKNLISVPSELYMSPSHRDCIYSPGFYS